MWKQYTKISWRENISLVWSERKTKVFDNQYNGKKKTQLVFFLLDMGKVCFQMVPLIHDAIYGGKHIGLVISPLKSLMIDQCKQTTHK